MNRAATWNRRPRVLLAEDHPAMLQATAAILSSHFDVVAGVSDGQAVLDEAAKTRPDLFVLDIAMPELDGLSAARELAKETSHGKIVFLSGQDDDDYISEALRIGAQGYVTKRRLQSDLVPALKLALGGCFFISPYAFVGAAQSEGDKHVLRFYSDDLAFYGHVSRIACTALNNGETVFTFLSKMGIRLVRRGLEAQQLDYLAAIRRGRYRAFSFENVMPLVMKRTQPDSARFEALFAGTLRRAAARSEERGSKMTIISDLTAELLSHGYSDEVACNFEALWNGFLPNHSCVIDCGFPVSQLGPKRTREKLWNLCKAHGNVLATVS